MYGCWSFTCYFPWTLDSFLKCRQLKSFQWLLVDFQQKWLNCFHLHILVAVPLLILVVRTIYMPPFLDFLRVFISTVSFLSHLDSYLDFLPAGRFPLTCDLNGFTWVTSTQPIKSVPGSADNFVVKSKLSFCSGSILLRKLIPIYQKGTWSLFLIKLLFLYSYWT